MSAPSETKRATSRAWYARNRTKHIANVLARRKTVKVIRKSGRILSEFSERVAYACSVMRRWHPILKNSRFLEDAKQVARVVALQHNGTHEIARAAQRAAYALEKELGLHDQIQIGGGANRPKPSNYENRLIERIDNERILFNW